MCDNVMGSVIRKNVIRDSNQRAVVVHRTNNVVVDNNVAYEIHGHGFFTEDGVERDVTFSYNLGASFHAPQHLINHPADGPESDGQVASFWITVTENNHWIGNVAAGSGRAGFWFDTRVGFRGNFTQPWNRDKSLGTFKDNTAHSNQWGFMWYSPGWTPLDYNVVENTRSYRNRIQGHFIHNNRNIHFKGGIIADNHLGATRTLDNVRNVSMSNFRIMGHTDTYAAIRRKRPGWSGDCHPYPFHAMFFHSKDTLFPELANVGITLEDTTITHGSLCPTPAMQMEGAHIVATAETNVNRVRNVTFPDGWAGPRFSKCQAAEPDLALKVEVLDGASSPTGTAGAYVSNDASLESEYEHCEPPEDGSCAIFCQNSPHTAPTSDPTNSTAGNDERIMHGKAVAVSASSEYPVGEAYLASNLFDEEITLADVGTRPNLGSEYAGQGWSPFVVKIDMGEAAVEFNAIYYAQRNNVNRVTNEIEVRAYLEDPGDVMSLKNDMANLKDADAVFYPTADLTLREYGLGPDLLVARYVVLVLKSVHPDVGGSALRLGYVPGETASPTASPTEAQAADLINVALGKTAYQSATAHGGTADRAVDGNTDGNWGGGSVTHGGGGANWWMADLEGSYDVHTIEIYNRLDCCKSNMDSINVLLFDENSSTVTQTNIVSDSADRVTWVLDVPTSARLVQIQSPQTLMLAEVEVYGVPSEPVDPDIVNLALHRPTSQKSSPFAPQGTSDRAVDGDTDGFWPAVTHGGGDDWWRVDLGAGMHAIHTVRIYNRLDCCMERLNSVDVLILDESDRVVASTTVTTLSAPMAVWDLDAPVSGRHVKVQNGQILAMAEVEVMGKRDGTTRRLLRGQN